MDSHYPDGFDQTLLDGQKDYTYIVEVSGFVEIKAYSSQDAEDQARDLKVSDITGLDVSVYK